MRNSSKMFLGLALLCIMPMSNSFVWIIGLVCIMTFVAIPEKE